MKTLPAALVALSLLVARSTAAETSPPKDAGKAAAEDPAAALTGVMSRTKVVHADPAIIEKLKLADARMRIARPLEEDPRGPETLQEAADYINGHVNMACPPGACLEYNGVFYFSGGKSTTPVSDFHCGFAVVKGKPALYDWSEKDEYWSRTNRDEDWRKPK